MRNFKIKLIAILFHHWSRKWLTILMALVGIFVALPANVSAQELTTLQNATTAQINAAKNYWIYAAISNNVYGDHIQISLPAGWVRVYAKSGADGLYAETFVLHHNGKIAEIVIAYRGTDNIIEDIGTGTLLANQIGDAQEYAAKIIANFSKSPAHIKFTGHSLGGALAINVAWNLNREAIVFDTSTFNLLGYSGFAKSIIRINEEGEMLARTRIGMPGDVKYNFIDDNDGVIANHGMYPLANGMKALALASIHTSASSNTQTNGTSNTPTSTTTTPATTTPTKTNGTNSSGNNPTIGTSNTPVSTSPTATQSSSSGADCVSSNSSKTKGLSGAEAAKALGTTKEWNRLSAIQQMASQNSICSPLSASGANLILQGTTSGAREGSISSLAKLIKDQLTGEEASTILGGVNELAEYNRLGGITSLAKAEKLGIIGTDAALFLKGTSGGAREGSIANIAKSIKPNLTGEEVATILGGVNELAEYNRLGGITSLAKSGKLKSSYTGDEMAAILLGTSGGARTASIAAITSYH